MEAPPESVLKESMHHHLIVTLSYEELIVECLVLCEFKIFKLCLGLLRVVDRLLTYLFVEYLARMVCLRIKVILSLQNFAHMKDELFFYCI